MPDLNKNKQTYFNVGFGILLLIVVFVLARGGLQEPTDIVLPEMPADSGASEGEGSQSGLNVIDIAPETVQVAISTLSRPVSYRRTQTVETFWSGGSGQSVSQVAVSGGYTRIDTTLPDGGVSHILVVEDTAAIWYEEEKSWTVMGRLTADVAQRMLTYEAVLELPVTEIVQADYRNRDGVQCIYVETAADDDGYNDRYWVSVASGLLFAAERCCEGEVIYRFTTVEPEGEIPEESLFLLPDGSALMPKT